MSLSSPAKSLSEILAIIAAIPEQMCGGEQPRELYKLSAGTRGHGLVVEIGTCAGKSAIALAYAQQINGRPPIHSIDITMHPELQANLARAGVQGHVRCSTRGSATEAREWTAPIELLWIDGDHSYKGVMRDIKDWSKKVMPGGLLAFHDYPAPGGSVLGDVGRAVYKTILARPDRWRVFADRSCPGSIIAFERLEGGTGRAGYGWWARWR